MDIFEPSSEEQAEANRIGDLTGMGDPDLSTDETPVTTEEVVTPEPKVEAPESSKKVEKPNDSEEDEGEDDGDKERFSRKDGKKIEKPEKSVPYSKHKEERLKRQTVETELATVTSTILPMLESINDRLDKMGAKEPTAKQADDLEDDVRAVAEELGLDPDDELGKVIKAVTKVVGKKFGKNDEITEKLKLLDKLQEKEAEREKANELDAEEKAFRTEFEALTPSLQKAYPNATQAQIKEAQELLDDVSHTEEYCRYKLVDIVNSDAYKAKFAAILTVAPKGKSGEPGKTVGKGEEYTSPEDDDTIEDLENLTPDIIRDRERRSASGDDRKDYTILKPIR